MEKIKDRLFVLLVEDCLINAELTTYILKYNGCKVDVAHNGKEAIEKYRSNQKKIDLIMLDIEMPIMDGYMTFEALKNEFQNDLCFVCAFSTLVNNENYASMGFDAFIIKPPNNQLILNLIEKVEIDQKHK